MIDNGARPTASTASSVVSRESRRTWRKGSPAAVGGGLVVAAAIAGAVAILAAPSVHHSAGSSSGGPLYLASRANLEIPAKPETVVARWATRKPVRHADRRSPAAAILFASTRLLSHASMRSASPPQPFALLPRDAAATDRFVPTAAPTVEIAALPETSTEPSASIVAAEPAPAPIAAAVPANAAEALEAVLVPPTPRSRPFRAPERAEGRREPPQAGALAYARPDAGEDRASALPMLLPPPGAPPVAPRAGNGVAVYDISAATVYLPNGERLEAHSGLGALRDDPRFVHTKMRGATPPHTYDLALRESRFHGVEAIRLKPIGGERRIYNRNGLLAHTYMLGKGGDSNGCVSFKNYGRFLAAFKRGEVRRLVVVPRMASSPAARLASLFSRKG